MIEEKSTRGKGEHGSFFWPIVFIGIGVVALLVNTGRLQAVNLWGLLNLWPLLLILAGLELLFARRLPFVGGILGLVLVGGVVWLLLQGWLPASMDQPIRIGDLDIHTATTQVTQDHYSEPRQGADSMAVALQLGQFDAEIGALPTDSANLFEATVDHTGALRFDVSGTGRRRVTLEPQGPTISVGIIPWGDYRWDVSLAQDMPLDIIVNMGSSAALLDLERLELSSLTVKGGSGSADVLLPQRQYALDYTGGSGELSLDVASGSLATIAMNMGSGDAQLVAGADADIALTLDQGGSGDLRVLAPRATALRVEVKQDGSGDVRLPTDVAPVSGKTGLWESQGYATAQHQVAITVGQLGSGDLIVAYR